MSLNSSSSGGSGSGGGGGGGSPCGACKFLRRKCVQGCVFAPYFDSDQGAAHFAAVHKVFGASNVSKLLLSIPMHRRLDAVVTICYEAQSRLKDPVYGCVGHIFALQQQVMSLQAELSYLQGHLATSELTQPPPPPQTAVAPPVFTIADLPSAVTAAMPAAYDLSSLFDPTLAQASWAMHQRANIDPRQYLAAAAAGPSPTTTTTSGGGGGALQAVARELPNGSHGSPSAPPMPPSTNASSSLSLSK